MATCTVCDGRGELENTRDRPWRTMVPNPHWEPYEPNVTTCWNCQGTGREPQ